VEAYRKLQRWWKESSKDVSTTTISPIQIQELERRYAVCLPEDFKAYLLASSPVEELWDGENTIWWHFDRIRNIPDEYEHEVSNPQIASRQSQYLFFADHCIWCWAWAISCTNDGNRGKVAIIGGAPDRFVADSFSEFVEKYLRDIRSVC
jgi:hypothetical protein